MKIIGLEEHMQIGVKGAMLRDGIDQVPDRLKEMDEAGIDMQVLNCIFRYDEDVGAAKATAQSRSINETLCRLVEKYPERFAAFATLALQDPEAAAAELERAVKELGLKGTMLASDIGGQYLDDEKFGVVLQMAEKLGVPIYLHPSHPRADMIKPFLTYPVLSGSMWGFSVEAGLHAMRLICSGTFDKFPGLQIILGHMGEGIPYWLWRLDNRWLKEKDGAMGVLAADPTASKLKKYPSQYFHDNFYITTSGMFWPPALQFASSVLGADRILLAVDYPQESNQVAVEFIEATPLSDGDKEKICHLNAERLLNL